MHGFCLFSLVCFSPLLAGGFFGFSNDAKQIETLLWPNGVFHQKKNDGKLHHARPVIFFRVYKSNP
jgi:hypothetical protein